MCYFRPDRRQRYHPINRIIRYNDIVSITQPETACILFSAIKYNNYAVIEKCLALGIRYQGVNNDLPSLQQAVQYGLVNVTQFKLNHNTYSQANLNDLVATAKILMIRQFTIYYLSMELMINKQMVHPLPQADHYLV